MVRLKSSSKAVITEVIDFYFESLENGVKPLWEQQRKENIFKGTTRTAPGCTVIARQGEKSTVDHVLVCCMLHLPYHKIEKNPAYS